MNIQQCLVFDIRCSYESSIFGSCKNVLKFHDGCPEGSSKKNLKRITISLEISKF